MSKENIKKKVQTLDYITRMMQTNVINDNPDVQRLSNQWDNNMKNGIVHTVLCDDYIPPIILADEIVSTGTQRWIIDGLQRLSTLNDFKHNNYKITSSIEDSEITYIVNAKNEDGTVKKDKFGSIIQEEKTFDIRNKKFSDLPQELKDKFDQYEIDTVIHLDCTMKDISKLIRRYNNHKAMNTSQKGFTYLDIHARKVKAITNSVFFKDCGCYTAKEKNNGTVERVVVDSIMATFFLDNWKKSPKDVAMYINNNATANQVEKIAELFDRLCLYADSVDNPRVAKLFNSKNTFVWIALFNKFSRTGIDDIKFGTFLNKFVDKLNRTLIDGKSWAYYEEQRNTKDKKLVIAKIEYLTKLLNDYLRIDVDDTNTETEDTLEFVRSNVSNDITSDDISCYADVLDDLMIEVDNDSVLLSKENLNSLICIIAYAFKNDIELDDWFPDYFVRVETFDVNQTNNYELMKNDLLAFVA